ncbi:MAG: glutamate--tRNA ligase [Pseudomonadota bacterium]
MTSKVRFAPSPTGNIHIGNARTALINWIFAQQNEGDFILRFDDTDTARSKQEFADGNLRDLRWLGIEPDQIEYQSKRTDSYRKITDDLIARGLLYACYETPEELDRKRKRLAARGKPPVYDRTGLRLTDEDRAALEEEGRQPHWRFVLPNYDEDPFAPKRTEIHWDDLVRGQQTVDLASISDPVLVRADGSWLYTLPSVIDDIEMGVTQIIRGDDHVTNTGVQLALFDVLGADAPQFGHHNLLTTASGEGLSKRLGSLSIQSLAEDGYEPMAVASLAVLIGAAGAVEAMPSMSALVERFDISAIGKSAAKFDMSELDSLNRRLVRDLEWSDVEDRFGDEAFGGHGSKFWPAIRENLEKVTEAEDWWQRIMDAEPVIDPEDKDYIGLSKEFLPPEPLDENAWKSWTDALKVPSGRKGKALFMPLRKALTGMDHGPDMAKILPIIGRERTMARLS